MAPPDVKETNAPPSAKSGILTPNSTQPEKWDLETELKKIDHRPNEQTESPVPFFHFVERLKTTKREGWRRFGLNHGESIADHMYRMAIITMAAPPSVTKDLDINRCTRMALVHDMAEGLVGDITPADGVDKSEKSRREAETIDYITKRLLGNVYGGLNGEQIRDVWWEYEDGKTAESKFVHDVDKIELILQMLEYERSNDAQIDLSEFTWVATRIVSEEVKAWSDEVMKDREGFWKSKGFEEAPKYHSKSNKVDQRKTGGSGVTEDQQKQYYGNGTNGAK